MKLIRNLVLGFGVGALLAYGVSCLLFPDEQPNSKTIEAPLPAQVTPAIPPVLIVKSITHLAPKASRTIYINGEISDASTEAVVHSIYKMDNVNEPLYIVLNSPGGSVFAGAAVITAMEAAKGPVYTVCNQMCASMAAMIFEYGKKRYMVDRSVVMFHPASGGFEGNVHQIYSRLTTLNRYLARMELFVATRAGMSLDDYYKKTANEYWLDSEDAKLLGFADEIASINMPEVNVVNIIAIPQPPDPGSHSPHITSPGIGITWTN